MQTSALEYLVHGVPRAVQREPGEPQLIGGDHLTRWFRRYYGITPGVYRGAVHPQAGELATASRHWNIDRPGPGNPR